LKAASVIQLIEGERKVARGKKKREKRYSVCFVALCFVEPGSCRDIVRSPKKRTTKRKGGGEGSYSHRLAKGKTRLLSKMAWKARRWFRPCDSEKAGHRALTRKEAGNTLRGNGDGFNLTGKRTRNFYLAATRGHTS